MRPDPTLAAGLGLLGADRRLREIAYDQAGVPRTYEERVRLLAEYKSELKREYHRESRRLHPDLNHDKSPAEQSQMAERLKQISVAYRAVMRLEPQRPSPPRLRPQRQMFILLVPIGRPTTATNSTTTGWGGAWWPHS